MPFKLSKFTPPPISTEQAVALWLALHASQQAEHSQNVTPEKQLYNMLTKRLIYESAIVKIETSNEPPKK